MYWFRRLIIPLSVAAVGACSSEHATPLVAAGTAQRAIGVQDPSDNSPSFDVRGDPGEHGNFALKAEGHYRFFVPADFNGGIFGGSVDNHVDFEARKEGDGTVSGKFHYLQVFNGQPFEFSGRVTCLAIYDTPVLARWPDIPAMTQNRAKWGGLIERSTDPDNPPGGFIWFQSIDNTTQGRDHARYPDLSTLSGFGDNTANEGFCASSRVPNPNFGPHAVQQGQIDVN